MLSANPQNPIDSLKKKYINASQKEKISFYNDVYVHYRFINPDTAIYYALIGKKYAIDNHLTNSEEYADLLNSIATHYSDRTDYAKALDNFIEAQKVYEKIPSLRGLAVTSTNIGYIYSTLNMFDKALSYYSSAIEIAKSLKDTKSMSSIYSKIGTVYYQMNEKKRALEYYTYSLDLAEQIADKNRVYSVLNNVAVINEELGRLNESLKYHLRALQISRELSYKSGTAISMHNIAVIHMTNNNFEYARIYLDSATYYYKEMQDFKNLKELYSTFSELFAKTGNYKEAIKYKDLAMDAQDSIMNLEMQNTIIETGVKYETEKKEIENKTLRAESERQRAVNERQRAITAGISIGLILFAMLATIIYRGYRQKQKTNAIITRQKEEVEYQKKLLEEKNKDILSSITYAKRIQEAILPKNRKWHALFPDSFVLYMPKDIVAGDFYWLEETDEYIYTAAADCTGHGVPGAMVSVVCSNALSRTVLEERIIDTDKILDRTREIVTEKLSSSEAYIRDGMDICLIRINKTNRHDIQYSGANRPLWITRAKQIIEYKPDKQSISYHENVKAYTAHTIALQTNDTLYLTTDGYTDQFGGEKQKKMGTKVFKELLIAGSENSLHDTGNLLKKYHLDWKQNHEQVDDITVIGIKV